ncbi:MAG: rubredoxin-like domain-containing protein [Haloplanus sp.]
MSEETRLGVGQTVSDAAGTKLGTIRGFDEDGFFVTTRGGIEALSVEHERAGHEFGEAELVWRCSQCGAVGDLGELPEACPDCDAPREDLYYWTED